MTAGLIPRGSRPPFSILALIAPVLIALPAHAADLAVSADIQRAYAASHLSTSEEPALRAERQAREPSPGFLLGAALGAWTAAAGQLDFDLKNPQGAGPPHVSQAGADEDAILMECADEKTAFDHLQSRSMGLGLSPQDAAAASGAADKGLAAAWQARAAAGPAKACR